jgi:hypothetical protein
LIAGPSVFMALVCVLQRLSAWAVFNTMSQTLT